MIKEKTQIFLKFLFEDLENFSYSIDFEENYSYINFTEILGVKCSKEMTFKVIDNKLQYHSITYGWKAIETKSNAKYFWIDLLSG